MFSVQRLYELNAEHTRCDLDESNGIQPLDIPPEPRMAAIADVEVPSSKPAMGIIRASANGQDGPEGTLGRGELGATMNTKTSDRHDLYLHLRARAFRLDVAILTEQCCAGDDTVYGNGQKYKPLTDTEYEALRIDLERVEVEIKEIKKGMSAVELAIADAEAEDIQEQISNYWEGGPRPGQTLEN